MKSNQLCFADHYPKKVMKKLLITVALIALAGSSMAQDAMKVVTADELVWKDEPVLPKGGQTAILLGDPSKAETIVLRVKFPPHYANGFSRYPRLSASWPLLPLHLP